MTLHRLIPSSYLCALHLRSFFGVVFIAAMATGCPAGPSSLNECLAELGDAGVEESDACARRFSAGIPNEPGAGDDAGLEEDAFVAPADACVLLVNKTCGDSTSSSCSQAPGCTAAQLVARYEAEDCEAAIGNEQSFPPCEAGACEVLVNKVCGEGGTAGLCAEDSTCGAAVELQSRILSADKASDRVNAEAACQAALADEQIFARCL